MSQFDAEALERAAKAARELEKSPHVKSAIELAKREQNVEARKAEAKAAEAKADMERLHVQQIEVQGAERRKTIQFQREQNEVRAGGDRDGGWVQNTHGSVLDLAGGDDAKPPAREGAAVRVRPHGQATRHGH